MAIWGVLGIEPTHDPARIRAAYAERLKVTHPEDDPEGFKTLRTAYEQALQFARWHAPRERPEEPEELDEFEEDDFADDVAFETPRPFLPLGPPQALGAPEPAAPTEAERDREEHRRRCARLDAALAAPADDAEITAAYEGVRHSPAMNQLDVYSGTEGWLIHMLHANRPASSVIVDAAIADFGWDLAAERVRDGHGAASVLRLRDALAQHRETQAFLARIQDRRHDFYPAYRELSRPFAARNGLSRFWALTRFARVRRLLAYVSANAPDLEQRFDAAALEWWRERLSKTRSPLWSWNVGLQIVIVVAILVAAVVTTPSTPSGPPPEATSPPFALATTPAEARGDCRFAAAAMSAPSAASRMRACERALELMPSSLTMRQYLAIMLLKAGQPDVAAQHFERILAVSSLDPYALYGRGLALWHGAGADDVRRAEGLALINQARSADPYVAPYFNRFDLPTPLDAVFEQKPPLEMQPRPQPEFDTPATYTRPTDEAFYEAMARFGFNGIPAVGSVRLDCIVRLDGSLDDCRVLSETPQNAGLAEVTLDVAAHVRAQPAMLAGAAVDGAPVLFPVSFREQ